ncbi:hypothetical protein K7957_18680 [Sphingomonas yunnanensis]|uniref:ribosome modulation factor n=1 Tax=Sphingomonas yunnanensis TaxID=310400 RepID=UPI001CA627D5|nr:hypothetical protein [Sphingomonas yunnanensis]MBY9064965.1 hypothetical protein [Sphingomonas yunnanensis]
MFVDQRSSTSPYAQSPVTVAQAFVEGRECGERSSGVTPRCPYASGSHEHDAWHRGYRLGRDLV